ncbi:MAG: protein kinase [Gemmatimonadota bacterium]|nr:protein kinase [Gemmatimonadota bacterium]
MSSERSPAGLAALEPTYEILRELGRGGTAVVYLARERATGHEVAIKLIHARYVEDDEAIGRFAREARYVARLNHPNVIPVQSVLDLGEAGIGLVMAHMTGRTLDQLLRDEGRLSPERAESILRDVASALDAAHGMDIVHRDVKPGNIFIEPNGRALLADFGLARSMTTGETQLTMAGVAIGTPTYMAPEQIDGNELDGRGDIYSLGLVVWEMLTGVRPWAGESLYAVLYHQKHEYLPDVREIRPDVPGRIAGIIARSIEKDPAARWQNMPELLAALDDPAREWPTVRPRPTHTETVRFSRATAAVAPIDWGTLLHEFPETLPTSNVDEARAAAATRRRRTAWVIAAASAISALAVLITLRQARTPPSKMTELSPALHARVEQATMPVLADSGAGQRSPGAEVGTLAVADSAGGLGRDTTPAGSDLARSVALVPPLPAQTDRALLAVAPNALSGTSTSAESKRAAARAVPAALASETPARSVAEVGRRSAVSPPSVSITTGGRHSCLLAADGRAFCWGSNDQGQLGGAPGPRAAAPALVSQDVRFVSLAPGLSHSCGIARGGFAWCWGDNDHGQLGDRTNASRSAPVRVGGDRVFTVLGTGAAHTCALDATGAAWCWGANSNGQLGDASQGDNASPVAVAGRLSFSALAVGWNFACGLRLDETAVCWGDGNAGQLGDGSTSDRNAPVPVRSRAAFVTISAGSAHACAITRGGETYCWGRNGNGQIGDGTIMNRSVPTRVQTPIEFTSVAAGAVHTCALDSDGNAYCWGRNTYGQLGDGSTTDRAQPMRVAGGHTFASIRTFGSHSCAVTASGEAFCWGYNADGQLGDGTRIHRTRPVYVERPAGT